MLNAKCARTIYGSTARPRLEEIPPIAIHPRIFRTSSVERLDGPGDQSSSTSRNQVYSFSLRCRSNADVEAAVEDAYVRS